MKGLAPAWLATMLLLTAGCAARPDWIQATLVTTDVTGMWRGGFDGPGSSPLPIALVLEQRGPKVTGYLVGSGNFSNGPLEGRVEGDVFRFATFASSAPGEAIVAGDEMTGELLLVGLQGGTYRLLLRRVDSSVPR